MSFSGQRLQELPTSPYFYMFDLIVVANLWATYLGLFKLVNELWQNYTLDATFISGHFYTTDIKWLVSCWITADRKGPWVSSREQLVPEFPGIKIYLEVLIANEDENLPSFWVQKGE